MSRAVLPFIILSMCVEVVYFVAQLCAEFVTFDARCFLPPFALLDYFTFHFSLDVGMDV